MKDRTENCAVEVATEGLDDAALRSAVETCIPMGHGGVVSIEQAPCRYSTVAATEIATAKTERGHEVRVFVKHVAEDHHPDKRPDRELRVYRDLFAGARLPVPALLGHDDQGPQGARLFLEHVEGWPLRYHGVAHWHAVVAELADLHLHFAGCADRLRSADFLLRLDRQHLRRWAARAAEVVRRAYPGCADALESALIRYPSVTDLLATAPLTLVHDDLAPKNVMVDPASDPARITFVDWELAGVGCGLMDLAHLKFGFVPEEDERMIAAYRRAVRSTPLDLDEDHFRRLLALCEAHKLLYRLASSDRWGLDEDTVGEWCEVVLQRVMFSTGRSVR